MFFETVGKIDRVINSPVIALDGKESAFQVFFHNGSLEVDGIRWRPELHLSTIVGQLQIKRTILNEKGGDALQVAHERRIQ
jgi:hypothetical protein